MLENWNMLGTDPLSSDFLFIAFTARLGNNNKEKYQFQLRIPKCQSRFAGSWITAALQGSVPDSPGQGGAPGGLRSWDPGEFH